MKKSELQKLIKEEIKNVIKEVQGDQRAIDGSKILSKKLEKILIEVNNIVKYDTISFYLKEVKLNTERSIAFLNDYVKIHTKIKNLK